MGTELLLDDDLDFENDDEQKGRYMTFKCESKYYGIAISYVEEIITIQHITEVPETQNYIKGLINLRGKIVPVIDIRLRFDKEPLEYDDRTCIIVVNVNNTVIGIVVDTIAEVVLIGDRDIVDPPRSASIGASASQYIYGIGKVGDEVKLLIDPVKLIFEDEEIG